MVTDNNTGDFWRTQPMYAISEAAQLAHVSHTTVRRWLYGYAPDPRFPEWRKPPVFSKKDKASPYVSFLQLIEIVVAADFRKAGKVKLDVVVEAHENARKESSLEYPFAHLQLEALGGHIIQWLGPDIAAAVDSPGQQSLPGLVQRRMQEIEYFQELAAKWYPLGKDVPIVVDPRFASGVPTVAGRGVTVGAIYKRWQAKQKIAFIADDLELEPDLVEHILQYKDEIAA